MPTQAPSRRSFLLAASAAPATRAASRRPNVVLFMTDDHGAWATGAYGAKEIRTPNIDRLAASGVRFTRAFAATPVCSPSRMTYMTGCLPSTHGVQDWLLPEDCFGPSSRRWLDGFLTWPEVLAPNGYALGMCGKWHMGGDEQAQRGFTEWATVPGGGGTYRDPAFVHNGAQAPMKGFKTDIVGEFALDFLNRQKAGTPFCLLVPFYAPHTPYDYQPEPYRAPYKASSFPDFPIAPPHPAQNSALRRMHGSRDARLGYSALVTAADANVGRILERLDRLGMREDTLVIFTADQGWNAGHHGVWGKGNGTVPFNLYEESIRVPMIWNHPARIRRPSSPAPMVSSYDFFPTLLDYLGLSLPADPRRVGRSYAGFIQGRPPRQWRNRLYFEYAYLRSLRTGNLKYIQRGGRWPSEMYDLETDPGEAVNILGDPAYRAQRQALHAEVAGFFYSLHAPPIDEWRSTTRQKLPAETSQLGR
jgi:choline-sulfatase